MRKIVYVMVCIFFASACVKRNEVKISDDILTIRVRVSRTGLDLPNDFLQRALKDLKNTSGVLASNTANPTVNSNMLTIDVRIPYISNNLEHVGVFRYFINDSDSGASAISSVFTVRVPRDLQGHLFETPVYEVRWRTQFSGK